MEIVKVAPLIAALFLTFCGLFFSLKSAQPNVRLPLTLIAIGQIVSIAFQVASLHFHW